MSKGYIAGILVSLSSLCLALAAISQPHDDADHDRRNHAATVPRWTIEPGAGVYRLVAHRRLLPPSGTATSEAVDFFRLATAEGTTIDFVCDLRAMAVIDELLPTVDVNSSREGLRLLAEVVLPRTTDHLTGEPLRILVFGGSYTTAHSWQRVGIADLPLNLQRSVRAKQLSHSEPIDTRGAYLDRLRLRLRPGDGETTVQIGDVQTGGAVFVEQRTGAPKPITEYPVRLASAPYAVPGISDDSNFPPELYLQDGILHVEGRPFLVRAMRYMGGPLRRAQELGFNVVVFSTVPSRAQEKEAAAAGLWLIAVPPDLRSLAAAGEMDSYPRVIAWDLGGRLTPPDLDRIGQWSGLIRRLDPARGRPLLASASYGQRAFSRLVDIVVLQQDPLGGPVTLRRFAERLDAERRLVLPGKTIWSSVQTQLPDEILHQVRCLIPGQQTAVEGRLPSDQISRLAWMAIAQGAGGLVFDGLPSEASFDGRDATATELRLLNHQLDVVSELLTRAGATRRVVELGGGFYGGVLSNGRTHYVLPWRYGPIDQHIPPSPDLAAGEPTGFTAFVVPGIAEPSNALLLTTCGVARLGVARQAGGVRVTSSELLPRDVILLTQDSLAARRAIGQVEATLEQTIALERNLLDADVSRMSRYGPRAPLGEAASFMRLSRWSSSGHPSAAVRLQNDVLSGRGAGVRLDRVALSRARSEWWASRAGGMTYRSTPLNRIDALWPADETFLRLDQQPLQTPNLLPAGELESVELLRQAGWRHMQLAGAHTEGPQIEVVSTRPKSGSSCLLIRNDDSPETSPSESLHVRHWIHSPVVPLVAGDVVRVSGWVRGEPLGKDSEVLAVIADSLGGWPLSLEISPGETWHPFLLYRATDQPHPWTLRLASRGPGRVYFDGVVVQRVRSLAQSAQ